MKNLYHKIDEIKFTNIMNNLVKSIKLLNECENLSEGTFAFELAFYSGMIGFVKNLESNIELDDLLINLNIEEDVMYELYNYFNGNVNGISKQTIEYYYNLGKNIKCYNKINVLNKILKMHLSIIQNNFLTKEKENVKCLKKDIIKTTIK